MLDKQLDPVAAVEPERTEMAERTGRLDKG